jgi:glycosyltransferase involved in cell wall biosynthesis
VPNKLAVLAVSNAPWAPTGYGTQIKQLALRMRDDGHHVAIAANYGLEATQTTWEGIEVLPKGFDAYSNDIVVAYAKDWARQHPDATPIVLTLYDVWVFAQHPSWDKLDMPIVSWVPIDHLPVPPKVADWCRRPNVTPVAMSHYGADQLAKAGIEHHCIPHGIETSLYKPTPSTADASGRERTGRELMRVPDDAHVTSIVNANKGTSPVRKAFAEQLMAWAMFAQDKPDAWLYLHTETGGAMGGIPLMPLLEAVGAPMDRVSIVNQYQYRLSIPDEAMAAIYSGTNVLLAPTLGEGYGLTVAEAAACETRSIVQDFTAQPELVSDGWKVSGQPLWDPAQTAWFSVPSVRDIVDALQQSYSDRRRSPGSRAHICAHYDADRLYTTGWRPLLKGLAS